MPKKKPSEPEESSKNQELVQRVDTMMSTELPADVPAKPMKAGEVVKPEVAAKPPKTPAGDPLEDNATDKAVDDIVAHEGDTVLAVNDALTARKQATAQPGQPSGRRSSHKWLWIIILVILLGTATDAAIFLLRP